MTETTDIDIKVTDKAVTELSLENSLYPHIRLNVRDVHLSLSVIISAVRHQPFVRRVSLDVLPVDLKRIKGITEQRIMSFRSNDLRLARHLRRVKGKENLAETFYSKTLARRLTIGLIDDVRCVTWRLRKLASCSGSNAQSAFTDPARISFLP